MLVLSRRKNESIVINDNITIIVVDVHGDKVRLGVEAPSDVTVHRKEVFEAIQQQVPGESSPSPADIRHRNSVSQKDKETSHNGSEVSSSSTSKKKEVSPKKGPQSEKTNHSGPHGKAEDSSAVGSDKNSKK